MGKLMRRWVARERVREREKNPKKEGSEIKKGAEADISIKLLVTTCISSLLATFSNKFRP